MVVLQCGGVAARDADQHPHRVHLVVRGVHLGQLNAGDGCTPNIGLEGGGGGGGGGGGIK